MSERLLVRCINDKRDNIHYPDGYIFYKEQLYEASDYRGRWGIRDHKHNMLTLDNDEFKEYFKIISDNVFSYKLWSTHHFYSQTQRIANKVELKCPCSPQIVQNIALGKSNPIKFHHSFMVHLVWKCEYCGRQLPFEIDLNKKTIKPFELIQI